MSPPPIKQDKVLAAIAAGTVRTSRDVCKMMGYTAIQYAQSLLRELTRKGLIEPHNIVSARHYLADGWPVHKLSRVYRITDAGLQYLHRKGGTAC